MLTAGSLYFICSERSTWIPAVWNFKKLRCKNELTLYEKYKSLLLIESLFLQRYLLNFIRHIVSNVRKIVRDELERIWKEAVIVCSLRD
jgi:hypothetical protein